MELDFNKFTGRPNLPGELGPVVGYGYEGIVYYNGVKIGKFHNVSRNYPVTVSTVTDAGVETWSSSFRTVNAALTELYHRATKINIHAKDVYPNEYYILRVSQIVLQVSPDPNAKPTIRCRIYYNTRRSTGNSEASKPATYTVGGFDKDSKKFIIDGKMPSDFTKFVNADSIADQVLLHTKAAVGETFA